MKINPVGIQAYQQLNRQQRPDAQQVNQQDQSAVNQQVTIAPQTEQEESQLAVKAATGSYADHLSSEERAALDLLFERFKDSERFGPGYSKKADQG
ncbi:hypothetical protein GF356_04065, partial [candidate division GN15 bacterium]|nr:hypothetical protein [candidate division GN15 bacterium]